MTEQFKIFETNLQGIDRGNPYVDVWLKADFINGSETVKVNGFYCGNGNYKIRFMSAKPGVWTAVTHSNDPLLDQITLTCECIPAKGKNHGRVLPMCDVFPGKN